MDMFDKWIHLAIVLVWWYSEMAAFYMLVIIPDESWTLSNLEMSSWAPLKNHGIHISDQSIQFPRRRGVYYKKSPRSLSDIDKRTPIFSANMQMFA